MQWARHPTFIKLGGENVEVGFIVLFLYMYILHSFVCMIIQNFIKDDLRWAENDNICLLVSELRRENIWIKTKGQGQNLMGQFHGFKTMISIVDFKAPVCGHLHFLVGLGGSGEPSSHR